MFSSTSAAVPPASVRAYHTLLLRSRASELKSRLNDDCSPALRRLIDRITPLKTFQDLAEDIDVSLSQVLRMAVHLVAWHGREGHVLPVPKSLHQRQRAKSFIRSAAAVYWWWRGT
jgi:hypothetical protein